MTFYFYTILYGFPQDTLVSTLERIIKHIVKKINHLTNVLTKQKKNQMAQLLRGQLKI